MNSVIYVKDSLGYLGESIKIYKIRTMFPAKESFLEKALVNELDSLGKINNDPRITPLGKILRKYFIDELPQIYNLAKGEIKLVGIRPKTREIWKKFPEDIVKRALLQKPGLIAFDYAFKKTNSFQDQLYHINTYLDSYEKDPIKTDREYLFACLNNIIFKGVRSS